MISARLNEGVQSVHEAYCLLLFLNLVNKTNSKNWCCWKLALTVFLQPNPRINYNPCWQLFLKSVPYRNTSPNSEFWIDNWDGSRTKNEFSFRLLISIANSSKNKLIPIFSKIIRYYKIR